MNDNQAENRDWYEPLQEPEKAADRPVTHEKSKKRKSKGLTPARIAGLVVLLLLVIAGSSLAFQHFGNDRTDDVGMVLPDISDEEMPRKPEDFFRQYYEEADYPLKDRNHTSREDQRVSKKPSGHCSSSCPFFLCTRTLLQLRNKHP